MLEKTIARYASKSPWLFHVNTGSCNGCDIEIVCALTPKYDAERFGMKLAETPRHADIVLVSGPITSQSRPRLERILAQVPDPHVVVSVGSCPRSGNVFKGGYSIEGPLDKYTEVDVSIVGCPPKPEAIVSGLALAKDILEKKTEEYLKDRKEQNRRYDPSEREM